MEPHETRYSPRLSSLNGALRLRQHLSDWLDHEGRDAARRNLLDLPSFLHRQAKTRGHRGSPRALPNEIRRSRCQIHRRQKVRIFVGAQHCCAASTTRFFTTRLLFSVTSPPSALNSSSSWLR